jgi:hypothetical protein
VGIQKLLQKLGYDPGKIDGLNGPHTEKAVKAFQKDHGLTVDGKAGPKTQAAMAQALKAGRAAPAQIAQAGAVADQSPSNGVANDGASNSIIGHWLAARQIAIEDLKALAKKVAATKHGSAVKVLKEINTIIAKLPAKPALNELDKLEHFVRNDELIIEAEKLPGHFHNLKIRAPLLKALAVMKR